MGIGDWRTENGEWRVRGVHLRESTMRRLARLGLIGVLLVGIWLGIYWAGSTENGIHALPILSNGQRLWAGDLGTPVSYGCVVLGTEEARMLYAWAEVGTPVVIQP